MTLVETAPPRAPVAAPPRTAAAAPPACATLPGAAELRELTARQGIDRATHLLYRRVLESPIHGPFIRRVAQLMERPAPAPWGRQASLAIVPAAFYRERPESGADGRLVREEAERLGCTVELVPLASAGGVRENARTLSDWLTRQPRRPVVLASLSKGGAEVKTALAEPDAAAAFSRVAAWLDLCGPLDGTPLAEWLLSRDRGGALARMYCRLIGMNLSFLGDLRHGPGTPLDFALRLPAHLRVIHIVGFPLAEHLLRGVTRRCHRRLAVHGPNDAGLLLADVCALPGLIYPIWGADHYLQPKADVRRLLAAILQYVDETWQDPPMRWPEHA